MTGKCIYSSFLDSPFSFVEGSVSFAYFLTSWRIKVCEKSVCHGWSFLNFKSQVSMGMEGAACHPSGPKHVPPTLSPPSRQILGCSVSSEGMWELKQMSYQKCFFLFGGRIREQCGLLNLCVWWWKHVGSYCQIISFLRHPSTMAGSTFKPGLANKVSTTTTHPTKSCSVFLILILLCPFVMLWSTVKLKPVCVRWEGNILHTFVYIHIYTTYKYSQPYIYTHIHVLACMHIHL